MVTGKLCTVDRGFCFTDFILLDSNSPSRDDHTGILQHFSFSLALRSEVYFISVQQQTMGMQSWCASAWDPGNSVAKLGGAPL